MSKKRAGVGRHQRVSRARAVADIARIVMVGAGRDDRPLIVSEKVSRWGFPRPRAGLDRESFLEKFVIATRQTPVDSICETSGRNK